jgi:hypothetical protein
MLSWVALRMVFTPTTLFIFCLCRRARERSLSPPCFPLVRPQPHSRATFSHSPFPRREREPCWQAQVGSDVADLPPEPPALALDLGGLLQARRDFARRLGLLRPRGLGGRRAHREVEEGGLGAPLLPPLHLRDGALVGHGLHLPRAALLSRGEQGRRVPRMRLPRLRDGRRDSRDRSARGARRRAAAPLWRRSGRGRRWRWRRRRRRCRAPRRARARARALAQRRRLLRQQ